MVDRSAWAGQRGVPATNFQPSRINLQQERGMEQTFVMVKPDGVRRGLVGEIIRRFEARGLTIAELRMIRAPRSLAEDHYGVHRDKPFFQGVVDFITSGPVVAMILEGENAVSAA